MSASIEDVPDDTLKKKLYVVCTMNDNYIFIYYNIIHLYSTASECQNQGGNGGAVRQ